MTDQLKLSDGLVLERHQCQWMVVMADPPYYRCYLSWGDGTQCSTIAVEQMQAYAQWIWKDDPS